MNAPGGVCSTAAPRPDQARLVGLRLQRPIASGLGPYKRQKLENQGRFGGFPAASAKAVPSSANPARAKRDGGWHRLILSRFSVPNRDSRPQTRRNAEDFCRAPGQIKVNTIEINALFWLALHIGTLTRPLVLAPRAPDWAPGLREKTQCLYGWPWQNCAPAPAAERSSAVARCMSPTRRRRK